VFDSSQGRKLFIFITVSIPAPPPPSPIQWVSWGYLLGIKRRGREADHLPLAQERLDLYPHALIRLNGLVPYYTQEQRCVGVAINVFS
jgi:hypothetical protein